MSTVKITKETLSRLNEKRTIGVIADEKGKEKTIYVEHNPFQNFLLDSLDILERTARGETKAELHLKKLLVFGHDRAITPSELRLSCGVNLNTCKNVMAKYVDEIESFNSKF